MPQLSFPTPQEPQNSTSLDHLGHHAKCSHSRNDAELELYRNGIPYRLERAGGYMEFREGTIFVSFPDSHGESGGFEISRSYADIALTLIVQALSHRYYETLDWRRFHEGISLARIAPDEFELTCWFTNDDGELVSERHVITKAASCTSRDAGTTAKGA